MGFKSVFGLPTSISPDTTTPLRRSRFDTTLASYTPTPPWLQKTISITGSSIDLTDYPVKLTVPYEPEMETDFRDIRFYDSDNLTELSYWIESYTASTSAIVWIKVPSIPTSGKTIYMHYGVPNRLTASDGYSTFDFFDDFHVIWRRQEDAGNIAYESCESNIIYDDNPQILTGASHVFKMWYRHGFACPDNHIYYAESLDAKTWTNYASNPILPNATSPSILKYNGVYYLFCRLCSDLTKLRRYHSTNGMTGWVDDGVILETGASGSWDDGAVAETFVWVEGPNDWKMLYEGQSSGGGPWKIGLATSTDGLNWVKSASNPVISETGSVAGPTHPRTSTGNITKYGGYYYIWLQRSPTGGLPTDINRYRSTDLINWTRFPNANTFPRATADEGVGTSVGQVADPAMFEYNGKVYMSYTATPDGTAHAGKLKLAIADMTVAELVTTDENAEGLSDQWIDTEGLTTTLDGETLTVSSDDNNRSIYTNGTFPCGTAVRTRARWSNFADYMYSWFGYCNPTINDVAEVVPPHNPPTGHNGYASFRKAGGAYDTVDLTLTAAQVTNYQTWEIRRASTDHVKVIREDVEELDYNDTTHIPTASINAAIGSYKAGLYGYYKFFLIRKYVEPEPVATFV